MSDNDELQQIAHLRREYTKGGLRRRDLPADPLTLFERWLSQACEAKLADPTAMVVATVDEHAQPAAETGPGPQAFFCGMHIDSSLVK